MPMQEVVQRGRELLDSGGDREGSAQHTELSVLVYHFLKVIAPLHIRLHTTCNRNSQVWTQDLTLRFGFNARRCTSAFGARSRS